LTRFRWGLLLRRRRRRESRREPEEEGLILKRWIDETRMRLLRIPKSEG